MSQIASCQQAMPAVPASKQIPRARIARSFALAANTYDANAALQRAIATRLLSEVTLSNCPETILDLGAGTGFCSFWLQERFPESQHVALDLALDMLHKTRERCGSHHQSLCADAMALPLVDNCVDLLVSSLAIQWCPLLEPLFAELYRVARPGAALHLSTFGPASLAEVRAAWQQTDSYTHVNQFADAQALLSAARGAGFTATLRSEERICYYESLYALSRELKGIGAHNMNAGQAQGLTSPARFRLAARRFAEAVPGNTSIPVTWEVYYLCLQKNDRDDQRAEPEQ